MTNVFRTEQLTHLALAQYHRWYQVYEVPFTSARIENQKDILSQEVEIITSMGTAKGKASIEERLKAYIGWQNAHHVQHTEVKLIGDATLSLQADILYQNIRPDDSRFSYTIHYSTELQFNNDELPLFTRLELKPTGEVKPFVFEAAYAKNRTLSFMHYWLFLMERPNFEKFTELLDEKFTFKVSSSKTISSLHDFREWLDQISEKMMSANHVIKNFSVEDNHNNTFSVSLDFDWKVLTKDNQKLIAETHHEWLLSNNMNERFARMREMTVTAVKPFQVVADW